MAAIEHTALWTPDLERARAFYQRYFEARAGEQYVNAEKQFTSYFLRFSTGARLELMHTPAIQESYTDDEPRSAGYAHLAFSGGTERAADELTERLRHDGYEVTGGPRRTGDGYYESTVRDPDGNRVEITV